MTEPGSSQWTTMFGQNRYPMNWQACWELAAVGWPWLRDRRLLTLRAWLASLYFATGVVPARVWRCDLALPLRAALVCLSFVAALVYVIVWAVAIALPVTALICVVAV